MGWGKSKGKLPYQRSHQRIGRKWPASPGRRHHEIQFVLDYHTSLSSGNTGLCPVMEPSSYPSRHVLFGYLHTPIASSLFTNAVGRGVPADLIAVSEAVRLQSHKGTTLDNAVTDFKRGVGALSRPFQFERDPARNLLIKDRREQAFHSRLLT